MSDNGEVKRIRPDGSVIRPDARVVAEQQAAFNAAAREADATMGFSPSVYGQAARESAIRAKLGDLPAAWDAIGGTAQMPRAPGKMFSRETICAIIRGQMAITHDSHLRDLLTIFERLE